MKEEKYIDKLAKKMGRKMAREFSITDPFMRAATQWSIKEKTRHPNPNVEYLIDKL